MNKLSVLVGLLVVALVASICVNAYQASQNGILTNENKILSDENSDQASELEMVSILTHAQFKINTELHQIGSSLVYACAQLSTAGLDGAEAHAILSALIANSSFIADASTLDLAGTFITVEPNTYSNLEGTNVTIPYFMFGASNDPVQPILSPVYPLVEGFNGSAMMAPVFGSDGALIGSVSLVFDPSVLIKATVTQVLAGTPYAIWASQTDGKMIYEVNPAEIGTNLFTDPEISTWVSLQAFMQHLVAEPAGYGTYEYYNYAETGVTVTKGAYWATVAFSGIEWRLVITNVLPA